MAFVATVIREEGQEIGVAACRREKLGTARLLRFASRWTIWQGPAWRIADDLAAGRGAQERVGTMEGVFGNQPQDAQVREATGFKIRREPGEAIPFT
jgi:hypothetical protein